MNETDKIMRLRKLTIHNIASIEDAEIDFEARPLSDAPVFLITGDTGSGKSTILDAICLALYATTPRFDNTQMEGDMEEAGKPITLRDPRQLMRRNTGEASVTLTFTGSNGVAYEAAWSVARARKRPSGALQGKQWSLQNLSSGDILTKDKDIKAGILLAVGLDFKQFCRTVMLAQGEFTRFLNSKNEEKASILEKITGMDIYRRLGEKIYQLTMMRKSALDEALRKVEAINLLDDGTVVEKKALLASLDTEIASLKGKRGEMERRCDWLSTKSTLDKSLADAEKAYKAAIEVKEGEDYRRDSLLIDTWTRTVEPRGWMKAAAEAALEVAERKRSLDLLATEFVEIRCGHAYAMINRDALEDDLRKTDAVIVAHQPKAAVYANSQAITGLVAAIIGYGDKIRATTADAEKEKATLAAMLLGLEKAACEYEKGCTSLEARRREVEGLDRSLLAMDMANVRRCIIELRDRIAACATARDREEVVAREKSRFEAQEKRLAAMSEEIAALQKSIDDMEEPLAFAKSQMERRERDYERQRESVGRWAKDIRSRLDVGDICPVCRQQVIAAIPGEAEIDDVCRVAREEWEKAVAAYRALNDRKAADAAKLQALTDTYGEERREHEQGDAYARALADAEAACRKCGIDLAAGDVGAAISAVEKDAAEELGRVELKSAEGEEMEKRLRALRSAMEKEGKTLEHLADEKAVAEKKVADSNSAIATFTTLVEGWKSDIVKSTADLRTLVGESEWQAGWEDDPAGCAARLSGEAKAFDALVEHRRNLALQLEKAATLCNDVGGVIAAVSGLISSWSDGGVTPRECRGLREKASGIFAEVKTAVDMKRNAEARIMENRRRVDAFVASATGISTDDLTRLQEYSAAYISELSVSLKRIADDVLMKKTLLDEAIRKVADHEKIPPALDPSDTPETLDASIKEIDAAIDEKGRLSGEISLLLRQDAERRVEQGTLLEDAARKKDEFNRWERLRSLLGDAAGKRFREIAQSYVLASLIHSANSYMRNLSDRYQLKVVPGTFVITIEDAYQGYTSRSTTTISGGESFLVSLSLALALSDIGSRLAVDTLFIDEGFGTLSGEPLRKAVDTLRSLHAVSGRHVGIISHVEELRERIPVQIRLHRDGNASSSIVTVNPAP